MLFLTLHYRYMDYYQSLVSLSIPYDILALPSSRRISSSSAIPPDLAPLTFLTIFFPLTLYCPRNSSIIASKSALVSLNCLGAIVTDGASDGTSEGASDITDASSSPSPSLYSSRIWN